MATTYIKPLVEIAVLDKIGRLIKWSKIYYKFASGNISYTTIKTGKLNFKDN